MKILTTLNEIKAALNDAGVDMGLWNPIKNINDLVSDIANRERVLLINDEGTLELNGSCVKCEIVFNGKRLIEKSITNLETGDVIHRNCPLYGKVADGDSAEDTVVREIYEELNIDLTGTHNLHRLQLVEVQREGRMHHYYGDIGGYMIVHHFVLELPEQLWQQRYTTIEHNKENVFEWE